MHNLLFITFWPKKIFKIRANTMKDTAIHILTTKKRASEYDCGEFETVTSIDDWDDPESLLFAISSISSTVRIDTVYALDEFDLVRAHSICNQLDLSYAGSADPIVFRDKFLMRQSLSNFEIEQPSFRKIDRFEDLEAFLGEVCYPIILKPRNQAGSMGVVKIEDPQQLLSLQRNDFENMIAEEFVNGQLYSVDGIYDGGLVSYYFSKYLDAPLGQMPRDQTVVDPFDEFPNGILEFVACTLSGLGGEDKFPFHLEFFVDDGEFVLCEVAARPGGGDVPAQIEASHGIRILEDWVKYNMTGKSLFRSDQEPRLARTVILPRGEGKAINVPEKPIDNQLFSWNMFIEEGKNYNASKGYFDPLVIFVLVGASEAELDQAEERIRNRVSKELVMELSG